MPTLRPVTEERDVSEIEPLLVKHKTAQNLLDCGQTYYWGLVKKGEIETVGEGKAGRAVFASLQRHVQKRRETARPTPERTKSGQIPTKNQPPAME